MENDNKPERNEPCPCGSGKKYKKCCMASDQNYVPPTADFLWHQLGSVCDKFTRNLMKYGTKMFGPDSIFEAWEEYAW